MKKRRVKYPVGYTRLHYPASGRSGSGRGFVAYSLVFALGISSYLLGWSGSRGYGSVSDYGSLIKNDRHSKTHNGKEDHVVDKTEQKVYDEKTSRPIWFNDFTDFSAKSKNAGNTLASLLINYSRKPITDKHSSENSIIEIPKDPGHAQYSTSAGSYAPRMTFAGLGEPRISHNIDFRLEDGESQYSHRFENGNLAVFSLDIEMQKYAEDLLEKLKVPFGALVAIDPKTGKILALADRSSDQKNTKRAMM